MYYKVLKDNKVIDVLDHLTFVKYQEKHGIMIVCPRTEAQAIISSDEKYFWHVKGLYKAPDCCDVVELQQINEYEYNSLKMLNLKSAEDIIDELRDRAKNTTMVVLRMLGNTL